MVAIVSVIVSSKDDPPPHSEMETLLTSSGLRHRYMSQCQPSPPPPNGSPQFGAKLTRSRSCPSSQLPVRHDDSASLSETTSSSNEDLSSKCLSLSLWPNSPEPRKPKGNHLHRNFVLNATIIISIRISQSFGGFFQTLIPSSQRRRLRLKY